MNVAIVGTGYVGLVTGACLAEAGHQVVCLDRDEARVAALERGEAFFYEPGLQEILARRAGRELRASTDLAATVAASDLTMLAVGTPTVDGSIDLSQIEGAAAEVGAALRGSDRPHLVVVKSTVLPGTTDDVVAGIVERASGRRLGVGLSVAMNPEFLREGNAVADFARPDRVVFGVTDALGEARLRELYTPLSPSETVVTTPRTAEMIKYASNALLATLISFSNEIGNLAALLPGVDAKTVMAGVKADDRWSPRMEDGSRVRPGILTYLEAGCGFGGSCFPKDVAALRTFARAQGIDPRMLDAVMDTNAVQPQQVIAMLEQGLGSLRGKKVAVLGLAFKPGTDDVRESPSLPLIRTLSERGAAVRAFDPVAAETGAVALDALGLEVDIAPDLAAAVDGVDAVALMTSWPEFGELRSVLGAAGDRADGPWIVDGRRMLEPGDDERYLGIGLGPR